MNEKEKMIETIREEIIKLRELAERNDCARLSALARALEAVVYDTWSVLSYEMPMFTVQNNVVLNISYRGVFVASILVPPDTTLANLFSVLSERKWEIASQAFRTLVNELVATSAAFNVVSKIRELEERLAKLKKCGC